MTGQPGIKTRDAKEFSSRVFLFMVGGQFHPGEYFEHFLFCWRVEDIARGEILCFGIIGVANAVSGVDEIVGRLSKLNVWAYNSQWAPGSPKGIPTLPAFTTRVWPIMRSNCMWVWPQTTIAASSASKSGRRRSSGVERVKMSFSFWGVAWQNRTDPRSGISSVTVFGHVDSHC